MPKVVAGSAPDPRADARSNVFLAATLVAAGTSGPVRVRNISPRGALLDGPNLPPQGSAVGLRRGSLKANGEIAWQERDQCGVRFKTEVEVEGWVRVGHAGQHRVDKIVTLLHRPPFRDAASLVLTSSEDSVSAISEDLTETCERLANIADLVAAQPEELLRLDAIAQRLRQHLQALDDML
jgi:hypothetical protein